MRDEATLADEVGVTDEAGDRVDPTELKALGNWATAQKGVNETSSRILNGPLADRRTIKVKALSDNTETVYVGPDGVTADNGYPLRPAEGIILSLDDTAEVHAVAEAGSQEVAVVEVAG